MQHATQYEVILNETELRFEVHTDHDLAYIDYRWYNDILVLLYIFVPVAYRGKGISQLLIEHALNFARTRDVKIKVFCPYIGKYIRMHPEYADLLQTP